MEDFAVGKPGQEKGADACTHALKRVRVVGWRSSWGIWRFFWVDFMAMCWGFSPFLRGSIEAFEPDANLDAVEKQHSLFYPGMTRTLEPMIFVRLTVVEKVESSTALEDWLVSLLSPIWPIEVARDTYATALENTKTTDSSSLDGSRLHHILFWWLGEKLQLFVCVFRPNTVGGKMLAVICFLTNDYRWEPFPILVLICMTIRKLFLSPSYFCGHCDVPKAYSMFCRGVELSSAVSCVPWFSDCSVLINGFVL